MDGTFCSERTLGEIRPNTPRRVFGSSGVPMADQALSERKPPRSETFVPEPLLDSEEAAAFIRIHPKTLQRFAREGQIQGIHIGKLWRFRQSALERWIERQTGTKVSA